VIPRACFPGGPPFLSTGWDGNRFEFFCETVPDDEEGKRVLGAYNAPSDPVVIDPLYT
jgi:hypothetical protein